MATPCARNLPQHFNGCACTPNAGVTAEVDLDLTTDLTPEPSWRDQPVIVEGRAFTLGDVYGGRLFHGSKHLIEDGAALEPGRAQSNFKESDTASVSITSAADLAHHWAKESAEGDYYVYEVEPVGPVKVWRAMPANYGRSMRLQEGRVSSARVVRRLDLDEAKSYEQDLAQRERDLVAATRLANAYCEAAGGARPGMCHTAAWTIRDEFEWPIVEGERDGLTHAWNQMPDGRIFDPTAAQFGEPGPTVFEAGDRRYSVTP